QQPSSVFFCCDRQFDSVGHALDVRSADSTVRRRVAAIQMSENVRLPKRSRAVDEDDWTRAFAGLEQFALVLDEPSECIERERYSRGVLCDLLRAGQAVRATDERRVETEIDHQDIGSAYDIVD